MTDKASEVQYEAATLANKHLGESFDKNGKKILGSEKGYDILSTYESAFEARTDPTTGLLNRRFWEDEMRAFFNVAIRNKTNFAIIMLDIDKLKKINDEKGHREGDRVLGEFGKAMRARFREADILGRYGGDEGIVMLTTGALEPDKIIEEERKITEELSQKTGAGVSVGIENWDGHSSLEETIKKADGRLYLNKNNKTNV